MQIFIIAVLAVYILYLVIENAYIVSIRKNFKHIIYVNGTRGKSTVTRMIYSVLKQGGHKAVCKTTGTVPVYIDLAGRENLIKRHGSATIMEQIKIMHRAKKENADIFVCECMAVNPLLQKISQEKMLRSDIGVITNVRLDHTDVMGQTLEGIAQSLSNTIPKNGTLFTAEKDNLNILAQNCKEKNCKIGDIDLQKDILPNFNFKENVAIAYAVGNHFNIEEPDILKGIKNFIPDPYDLSVYKLKNKIFVNGFSANDIQSTKEILQMVLEKYNVGTENLALIINNRNDRGYRANQMIQLATDIKPKKIILMGDMQDFSARKLKKAKVNSAVETVKNSQEINFENSDITLFFATGNIANQGKNLTEKIKREGVKIG